MGCHIFRNISILLFILFLLIFFDKGGFAGDIGSLIVINEIMFDPEGSDSGNEWIELYNIGDTDITANNWRIFIAGTTFVQSATFSGTIPSKSYYLICEENIENCNINIEKIGMQNGGGATDALRITSEDGTVIDEIFYDTPNINNLKNSFDEIVLEQFCAKITVSGESIGRKNVEDDDFDLYEFYAFSTPTPGHQNQASLSGDEIAQTGQSPTKIVSFFIISFFSAILLHNLKLFIQKNAKNHKESN